MSKGKVWLCTKNKKDGGFEVGEVPLYLEKLYKDLDAEYVVGQHEVGENGVHHIQFFVSFKTSVRITKLTKFDKTLHAERVKVNNGADRYCMKDETRVEGPWEFGNKPLSRSSKKDWELIWKKASLGKLLEIPASIRVTSYNKLKAIYKDHMTFEDADHLRGIWIYGDAGSGKSRWVREQCKKKYPNEVNYSMYPKLCNKWFDGYKNEKVIVMDDVAPEHFILCQQLKIWSDRYGCVLETKGGALPSKYEWFIVTSQYRLSRIAIKKIRTKYGEEEEEDKETFLALQRRFMEYNIDELKTKNLDDVEKEVLEKQFDLEIEYIVGETIKDENNEKKKEKEKNKK